MTEVQIILPPRAELSDALEFGLISLVEAISQIDDDRVAHGLLGGEFGYGAAWENDLFMMKPYCWCERKGECPWCTGCGAYQDTCKACSENEAHDDACFQNELQRRFKKYDAESGYNAIEQALHGPATTQPTATRRTPFGTITLSGMRTALGERLHKRWCKAHDERTREHGKLTKVLYQERGIKPSPFQWYCDCGADERRKAAIAAGEGCDYNRGRGIFERFAPWTLDHKRRYYDPPNFWHKSSNFRVCWYKWIGRDMVTNRDPHPGELQEIFSKCAASLLQNPGGPMKSFAKTPANPLMEEYRVR